MMTSFNESVRVELARRIAARAHAHSRQPTFVGLCGSQGSGKSTLAAGLKDSLENIGVATAIVSIDDLYLTFGDRQRLARSVHPLLRTRGAPGTHDVSLGLRVFAALEAGEAVSLPSFDKAADDRRPERDWPRINSPMDVVVFEGWCVGASPQVDAALADPVNALEREEDANAAWRRYVNDALAGPYQALFGQLDMLILLAAPSFDVVYGWRLEQENELRKRVAERGEDGSRLMTDSQLRRFISHYERLTRHILEEMPSRADIVVRLDAERRKTIEYRNR